MASVDENNDLIDLGGQSRKLSDGGAPTFNNDTYLPYASLNGSTQYFARTDEAGLDITGDLTQISIAYFDNTASASEAVSGKYNTVSDNRSWLLFRDASGFMGFLVSSDGLAQTAVVSPTTIASGDWVFSAGRYTASSEVAVFVGYLGGDDGILEKTTNTTSIPASIFNSNADFAIGGVNTGGTPALLMTGRASLTILCAAALADNYLNQLYSQVRDLYEV